MGQLLTRRQYWKQQLAECESAAANPDSHSNWLRRAYLRVYHFLLARYAVDGPLLPDDEQVVESFGLPAEGELLTGKPARSLGEIQHTLKNIHNARPKLLNPQEKAAAEMTNRWITVASESRSMNLDRCKTFLNQIGVESRLTQHGTVPQLQVRYHARAEALELLREVRPFLGHPKPTKRVVVAGRIVIGLSLIGIVLATWMFAYLDGMGRGMDMWEAVARAHCLGGLLIAFFALPLVLVYATRYSAARAGAHPRSRRSTQRR